MKIASLLLSLALFTLPAAAADSKTLAEHIAELKKEGISTNSQLCEYAGRGSSVGNAWHRGACKFPNMFGYEQHQELYDTLSSHLAEPASSFDLQAHLAKSAERELSPAVGDITFAGIGGKMSYGVIAKKICSLDFVTQIGGKPKEEFCNAPLSYIVNVITFHDAVKETFVFNGIQLTAVAGNSVKLHLNTVTIEGVKFQAQLEFGSAEVRDLNGVKGMLIRGDTPMEFMGGDGNYIGKYYLMNITLVPWDSDNRALFESNYVAINSLLKSKFGDAVSDHFDFKRKTDMIEVNATTFMIRNHKLHNPYGNTIRYIFKGNVPNFESYKGDYLATKKSSVPNSDI